jgi:hypothetical protein
VAKRVKKRVRREYTKAEEKELRAHSKAHCARKPAAWVLPSGISVSWSRWIQAAVSKTNSQIVAGP